MSAKFIPTIDQKIWWWIPRFYSVSNSEPECRTYLGPISCRKIFEAIAKGDDEVIIEHLHKHGSRRGTYGYYKVAIDFENETGSVTWCTEDGKTAFVNKSGYLYKYRLMGISREFFATSTYKNYWTPWDAVSQYRDDVELAQYVRISRINLYENYGERQVAAAVFARKHGLFRIKKSDLVSKS